MRRQRQTAVQVILLSSAFATAIVCVVVGSAVLLGLASFLFVIVAFNIVVTAAARRRATR